MIKRKFAFGIFISLSLLLLLSTLSLPQEEAAQKAEPTVAAGSEEKEAVQKETTAAEAPAAEPSAEKTVAETAVETPAEEAAIETAPGNVTMDFKDADINNVLRILSYKSGVNIVAGPEVKGMVTIRLTNVPWEKALEVVLRTYGFSYEKVGNIIRVTTIESLKQEELATETFTLSYGKAADVAEALDNMLTERGKTKFDERTNTLIVTDIPTNLYKISKIIDKLDRRTPQIMIEAKVIETTLADDETLGVDWNVQASLSGASRPTTIPFGRFAEQNFEERLNQYFPVGQSTNFTPGGAVTTATQASFPAVGGPEWLSPFPFAPTTDFNFGTMDFTTFQATLQYLKSRANTDILSNPKITTLDNQEASILVGEIIGIPTYERNSETGSMEITGYEEKQVGVKLSVTPHVNFQGDISIDLKPEISDLLRYDTLDAARGIVAPVFSTRQAETQVMMKDGETLMIGGLIRKTVMDSVDKIPLLGDIPLLGRALFSQTQKEVERTELIIFLTVRLVEEEWVPPAGSAAAFVELPNPKDAEVWKAIPRPEGKKRKLWWQWW